MTTEAMRWEIGSDACALVEEPEGCKPPVLFVSADDISVELVPPTDREDLPEFCRFLRDLSDAARDLQMMCHRFGVWGRHVSGGDGGGVAEAGSGRIA
jgi:hypothetical protein